jgi:NitT/TauT family transport system ATP-binding protein
MTEDSMLEVRGLGHEFGRRGTTNRAIDDLTFQVHKGELVCIVGPSGCGKSTLLRAVSGLVEPTEGEVSLHGRKVTGAVPDDLAVVFQDYSRSLYPWLTAAGNVALPLRHRRLPKSQRRARTGEALAAVGLADAHDRYPWQLSGGMQQRVAIARALACHPVLLLMDEPFASVDAQTRFELEDLLLTVRAAHSTTVLLVTHDIDESVYLGDRVIVLSRSPARVLADLPVDLPADRHQITTRASAEFVALRAQVAELLHVDHPRTGEEDPARKWRAAERAEHPAAAAPVAEDEERARR